MDLQENLPTDDSALVRQITKDIVDARAPCIHVLVGLKADRDYHVFGPHALRSFCARPWPREGGGSQSYAVAVASRDLPQARTERIEGAT